jgi:hypothetical protein
MSKRERCLVLSGSALRHFYESELVANVVAKSTN